MKTSFIRGMLGAALFLACVTTPAVAATPPVPVATAIQCVLEPGIYGVLNSAGELVGILIVYPDCRMEFKRAQALV